MRGVWTGRLSSKLYRIAMDLYFVYYIYIQVTIYYGNHKFVVVEGVPGGVTWIAALILNWMESWARLA